MGDVLHKWKRERLPVEIRQALDVLNVEG